MAQAMRPTSGLRCKTYVGEAGATVQQLVIPANEVKICKEDNLELSAGKIDASTRGSDWRMSIPGLKEGSAPLTLLYMSGHPKYDQLMDAFDTGDPVAVAFVDNRGAGIIMDAIITNFTINRPLEDAVTCSVTLDPTFHSTTANPDGRSPTRFSSTSTTSS